MSREPVSDGRAVVLLGGLAVAALFAFVVLPRWTGAPVVTTVPTAVPDPPSSAITTTIAVASVPPSTIPRAARRPEPDPPASTVPDEWSGAVSEGLAALERGAFAEARDAFSRAEALRPGTGAVADGLARAQAGLAAEELSARRSKAEGLEAREEWRAALSEYEAALKLDPALTFAVEGRARAARRAALAERLQRYLDRPERLSTAAVAREAAATLEDAAGLEASGLRLAAKRAALERLLAGAARPVTVLLRSNGLTQVTILRVGPVGSFKEKSMELRPGSYQVLGARAGYRDVRRALVVPVGRSPEPLDVRCDEAL